MNTTMNINFLSENITDTQIIEFFNAVRYENADMSIQLCNDNIERLNNQIANLKDKYTLEEVAAFKSKLEVEQESKKSFERIKEETINNYNNVIASMTSLNSENKGNNTDVVRTVLRVLASWNNNKLVKYVIIPVFSSPELYNALEAIHINSKAGEDGNIAMSKEVKAAYKAASAELERIIKVMFSLPFETKYTSKTRVKLTAEDKKLLHDCYITGFRNKFNVDDKTGIVSFEKRNINTLVKTKKDRKTGKVTYDYSRLAGTICNIVIKHYFA